MQEVEAELEAHRQAGEIGEGTVHRIGWWIPTRSATPSTALVPQRKVGFPIPNPRLLLGFQGTKTARREGISSPFSDAGGCTSPQNSGAPGSKAVFRSAAVPRGRTGAPRLSAGKWWLSGASRLGFWAPLNYHLDSQKPGLPRLQRRRQIIGRAECVDGRGGFARGNTAKAPSRPPVSLPILVTSTPFLTRIDKLSGGLHAS